MRRLGTVSELWRYPIKSMGGERLTQCAFDASGMVGDRRVAFKSTAAPFGKPLLSSQERTAMLRYGARLTDDSTTRTNTETLEVTVADGRVFSPESAAFLKSFQTDLPRQPQAVSTAHGDVADELTLCRSPERPLTDVRPVSFVSMSTLAQLTEEFGRWIDPQRFRSNVVLTLDPEFAAPFAEDRLAGRTLRLGGAEQAAVLIVNERIPRCRIVSLDPATAEADPSLLRHLARHHEGRLGIYATPVSPGRVHVGDPVDLV